MNYEIKDYSDTHKKRKRAQQSIQLSILNIPYTTFQKKKKNSKKNWKKRKKNMMDSNPDMSFTFPYLFSGFPGVKVNLWNTVDIGS